MASPIAESWIYATILIKNEWGNSGTGFLVARDVEDGRGAVFLATNKHVLHQEAQMRQSATRVFLHVSIRDEDGSIAGEVAELPLNLEDGSKIWRENPDRDVDVLAFNVTPLIVQLPQMIRQWPTYSLFGDQAKLDELEITIAEDILVIGYPLGLRHANSNFPLVRSGIIATRIGENLKDEVEEGGIRRQRLLRGFLIDGAVVPGSSGSPVILKPSIGRFKGGAISIGTPPPLLLGIVAETKYAPVQTPTGVIPSFAGLGLAFDAETVRETIELFFSPGDTPVV